MTKEGIKALRKVRVCAKTVRHLEELSGSDVYNLPYFKGLIKRRSEELKACEEMAQPYLDDLTPIEYAFVSAYFFGGLNLEEVSKMIDRSSRQCARLRSKFGKWDDQDR